MLDHPLVFKDLVPFSNAPKVQLRSHDGKYTYGVTKQDEYIKQLASKVDLLTTHNRMLEAQIAQKVSFSSTFLDRLPNKLEPNPREYCNYVTLKEEVED